MSTKDEQEILTLDHYLKLKAEGYEFEGQSYLFWEYMRLLTALKLKNPNIKFLLENVMMGEKWEKVLSKAIGVNPICINSALVSAQNRQRLYWTNIGLEPAGLFGDLESTIQQPKDKGIFLKNILEKEVANKYFLRNKEVNDLFKPGAYLISNQGNSIGEEMNKSHSLMARDYKGFGNQGMTGIVSEFQKGSLVQIGNIYDNEHNSVAGRVYTDEGKSVTLSALGGGGGGKTGLYLIGLKIRRLTPKECERLQTVKDDYTNHVSDTQRYRMLGNGWTVDAIVHILSYWKK